MKEAEALIEFYTRQILEQQIQLEELKKQIKELKEELEKLKGIEK